MTQSLRKLLPATPARKGLLFALYLLPFTALLWFVWRLSVNIPFGDQWNWIDYFEQFRAGKVSFGDLFVQHNEHRMVLPRLLFPALAFATHWNIRYEIALSLFCSVLTFLALLATALRNFRLGIPHRTMDFHGINIVVGCLVFSWVQYQNWLWGFQVPWFFINTCLAIIIFVLGQDSLRPMYRLAIASIICFIASFSSAHGLFIWIAVLPSVAVIGRPLRAKIQNLTIWILQFAVCMAIYLIGYETPSHAARYYSHSLTNFLGHFLAANGMSLLSKSVELPTLTTVGILIVGLFIVLSLRSLRSKWVVLAAPWISLGAYAIIFSLVNSYGRSGYNIESSLESRYTTPGLLLVIAIVQLLPIVVEVAGGAISRKLFYVAAALFFVLLNRASTFAFNDAMFGEHGAVFLRQETICLELIYYMQDAGAEKCLEHNNNASKSNIIELGQMGLRETPQDITFLAASSASDVLSDRKGAKNKGYSKELRLTLDEDQIEVSGFIELPETLLPSERPTAVALAPDDQQSFITATNLDFERKHGRLRADWKIQMNRSTLIALVGEAQTLKGYLYYPQQKQFDQLKTVISLDTVSNWKMLEKALKPIESGKVFSDAGRSLERRAGPDDKPVVLAHANTKIVVALPKNIKALSLGYGILDEAWQEAQSAALSEKRTSGEPIADGVEFRVLALDARETETVLFSQWLDPHAIEADRGEHQTESSLPIGTQKVALETLKGSDNNGSWDWSY